VAPIRVRTGVDATWMPGWFGVVGALVGGFAGAVRFGFDSVLGAGPSAVLAAGTLVVATGALHVDGLADCADGLGVRAERARRLAVMREPQVGVFGVLTVVLWLLLLVSALSGLSRGDALRALVVACGLGRSSALLHAVLAPPARSDGLGAAFHVDHGPLVLGTLSAVALSTTIESPMRALGAIVAATITTVAVSAWACRSLGGRTGDTLGASVALVEVIVCLVMLGFARS
jgi:adenosylcobinamide-GDP ribazoletransferase